MHSQTASKHQLWWSKQQFFTKAVQNVHKLIKHLRLTLLCNIHSSTMDMEMEVYQHTLVRILSFYVSFIFLILYIHISLLFSLLSFLYYSLLTIQLAVLILFILLPLPLSILLFLFTLLCHYVYTNISLQFRMLCHYCCHYLYITLF
jgi:hypothetical protein